MRMSTHTHWYKLPEYNDYKVKLCKFLYSMATFSLA